MSEHNGWTNYETWVVNLWLDNDQSYQDRCIEITQEGESAYHTGKMLQEFVEESLELHNEYGLKNNLIASALSIVNWTEIAQRWIDDYHEEETEEEQDE